MFLIYRYCLKSYEDKFFVALKVQVRNSIIPIAAPLQYIGEDYTFDISCQVFGDKPESCILWKMTEFRIITSKTSSI